METKHFAMFDRFELELYADDALDGSAPGMAADETIAGMRGAPYIAEQLEALAPETVRAELREYGAWDDAELADHDANLSRILWIACGNIRGELS